MYTFNYLLRLKVMHLWAMVQFALVLLLFILILKENYSESFKSLVKKCSNKNVYGRVTRYTFLSNLHNDLHWMGEKTWHKVCRMFLRCWNLREIVWPIYEEETVLIIFSLCFYRCDENEVDNIREINTQQFR